MLNIQLLALLFSLVHLGTLSFSIRLDRDGHHSLYSIPLGVTWRVLTRFAHGCLSLKTTHYLLLDVLCLYNYLIHTLPACQKQPWSDIQKWRSNGHHENIEERTCNLSERPNCSSVGVLTVMPQQHKNAAPPPPNPLVKLILCELFTLKPCLAFVTCWCHAAFIIRNL